MTAHLKYLWFIIRHKYYVFVAGEYVGMPEWRLLLHDLSKFRPSEWFPYCRYFYGSGETTQKTQEALDRAWLRHIHRNDHHWQYWILREDNGGTKLLDMSDKAIQEMVADWAGAGKAITGEWDLAEWYRKSKHLMLMSPSTRIKVEAAVKLSNTVLTPTPEEEKKGTD